MIVIITIIIILTLTYTPVPLEKIFRDKRLRTPTPDGMSPLIQTCHTFSSGSRVLDTPRKSSPRRVTRR